MNDDLYGSPYDDGYENPNPPWWLGAGLLAAAFAWGVLLGSVL
jgi:hypothetical protein